MRDLSSDPESKRADGPTQPCAGRSRQFSCNSHEAAARWAVSIAARSGRGWRIEAVAAAADGCEERRLSRAVELITEVSHVDVDDIRLALKVVFPDSGQNLLAGEKPSRIAGEVFEQGKLSARKGNLLLVAPDAMRQQVDAQALPGDGCRLRLIGSPRQRSDTGQ